MPYTIKPLSKNQVIPSFYELLAPAYKILSHTPPLEAKGDRQLQMTFEHQLKALIFYHLEEHSSGSHLVVVMDKARLHTSKRTESFINSQKRLHALLTILFSRLESR